MRMCWKRKMSAASVTTRWTSRRASIRREPLVDLSGCVGQELLDRLGGEGEADHRRRFDDEELVARAAGRGGRRAARRSRPGERRRAEKSAVGDPRAALAAGALRRRRASTRAARRTAGLPSAASAICASASAGRLAAEHVARPAGPTASALERAEPKLGRRPSISGQSGWRSSSSGRAVQMSEERGSRRGRGDVVEQVEQRGLGPVDVLDHRDDAAVGREVLEQLAGAPEELVEREALAGQADGRGDPRRDVGVVRRGRRSSPGPSPASRRRRSRPPGGRSRRAARR